MSSTIPYQEHTTESVDLAEGEVPTIVLPNGDRLEVSRLPCLQNVPVRTRRVQRPL